MSGSQSSLQKAIMKRGDFHLRRDDRQMFGNFVVLSSGGGTAPQSKVRRSAMFVETPVYPEPRFWKLDVSFQTLESDPPFPLSPWVPSSLVLNTVRITVRQALDRDKQTTDQIFDLRALTQAPNLQTSLPQRFFNGQQIAVSVESIGDTPTLLGVQVTLVEVTALDRDPYRNATLLAFPQSALSANFLLPNEKRRQFFVQNGGTTALYLAFDFFAIGPGALAHFTIALPNPGDIYESPRDCWQGYVSGVWEADGAIAADQAVVTEGF